MKSSFSGPILALLLFLPVFANKNSNLDHFVRTVMREHEIPGLSIGLVKDQELIYAKGFGYSNRKQKTPAQSNTIYGIASLSKLFTEMALLQLIDAGKIGLHEPITRALPTLKIPEPYTASIITPWHLLTHTSGLPKLPSPEVRQQASNSLATIVPAVSQIPLLYQPGKGYQYSNISFLLIGALIQELTGLSFTEYMEQYIFKPLIMNMTAISYDYIPHNYKSSVAQGYTKENKPGLDNLGVHPAGSIYSTARDMAHFIKMIFNKGTYNNSSILNPETLATMLSPQYTQDKRAQGIAWILTNPGLDFTHNVIWHNGRTATFSSDLLLLPEEKIGIIILSNKGTVKASEGIRKIAKELLWRTSQR